MERNFKNEDFEQFLKRNADGLRMRPSEKVWKGISNNLNRRRRRMGFFLGFTLLVTSSLGYYMVNPSSNSNHSRQTATTNNSDLRQQTTGAFQTLPGNTVASSKDRNLSGTGQTGTSGHLLTTGFQGNPDQFMQNPFPAIMENEVIMNGGQVTNEFEPTVVDEYPGTENVTETVRKNEVKQVVTDPLSIESVTNSYSSKLKKGRLGLQVFFTPTVSYRSLRENKDYSSNTTLAAKDVNGEVNHKPDLGVQLGILARYPVSQKVKLRGGLQFNVNRYDIRAFTNTYEVATIRFSNRETVNTVTGYNNYQGYKTDWLQNFYLQVSAPVGLEVKLAGNKRNNVGVAASIQPTYLIGDKAYVISTDYKNYMEVPWLVRDWNVNTSFEAFVSYSTGKTQWQVGPQVRYQLLSSYEKKYPVKEHLYDFGLRVGISLNNR